MKKWTVSTVFYRHGLISMCFSSHATDRYTIDYYISETVISTVNNLVLCLTLHFTCDPLWVAYNFLSMLPSYLPWTLPPTIFYLHNKVITSGYTHATKETWDSSFFAKVIAQKTEFSRKLWASKNTFPLPVAGKYINQKHCEWETYPWLISRLSD